MNKRKKVGIMGGTFNPIHTGHLILAEHAYEQFQLDSILIMPSKNPPHKLKKDVLSDEIRSTMITLAINDNPHFELSTVELNREGLTYTADTLEYLTAKYPNTDYYFIIGADSLYQMDSWKAPKIIFEHAIILAATRYGLEEEKLNERIHELEHNFKAKINILCTPNMDISSQYIRECLANNKSIKYYVPDKVEEYIKVNQLYNG